MTNPFSLIIKMPQSRSGSHKGVFHPGSEFSLKLTSVSSSLIIQGILLFFDIVLFARMADHPVALFSGHGVIAFFSVMSFRCSLASVRPERGVLLFGSMMAVFLPVAGLFCLFTVALFMLFKPLPAGDLLGAFQEHLHEGNFQGNADHTSTMNPLKGIEDLEPLSEMLTTKDPQRKRAILETIAQGRNPKLLPLLVEAIRDPRPEIYQFAIAKAAELHHEYTLEISLRTEAMKADPENLETHYHLVKAYRQYLNSGLVSPSVADFYLTKLHGEIEKKLDVSFENDEKAQTLGQMLLEVGCLGGAEKIFRQVVAHQPSNVEAQTGLFQALYRKKCFQEMFGEICLSCERAFSAGETEPGIPEFLRCSVNKAARCRLMMSHKKALLPVS